MAYAVRGQIKFLRMKNTLMIIKLMLLVSCLFSCEKANFSTDEEGKTEDGKCVTVSFNVSKFEQIDFENTTSSRSTVVGDVCTRISYVIYSGKTKIKVINQEKTDADFGTVSLNLDKDSTYRIVIVAHNGLGVASFSSTDNNITFKDNKVTDTFYYSQPFKATEGVSYNVELKRIVAMFRLKITDNMPGDVKTMQFKYTGGSSTLDAEKGLGCVNSRQTENREVTSSMTGHSATFDVYTFPHDATGELKITVTALDANSKSLYEREFDAVPVKTNQITQYSGNFFGEGTGGASSNMFIMVTNDNWSEENYVY